MKISVITVCRNAEKEIEKTILSVLNQTCKDFEYIIIDGASTDGTLDIIEKYRDKLACIVSEPDKGLFNAMNKGIKKATGDLLFFPNAGDVVYDKNVFSDVIKEFKKETVDFIFGDMFFVNPDNVDENITTIKSGRRANLSGFVFNYSLYHGTPPQPAAFFKKEIFDKCGKFIEEDGEFIISPDFEYFMRIMIRHRLTFKYIDRVISKFAIGGQSSLKKNFKAAIEEHRKIIQMYPELNPKGFKKYKFFMTKIYPFIFKNFKFLIRKYNSNKNIKEKINRIIAPFIGGHLNLVYSETNSITGHIHQINNVKLAE